MSISDMPIEELRETPFFHQVDPKKLESLEHFTAWLDAILHNSCSVWEEDGESFLLDTRQLVDRVNGLKIEVYPDEHPPPHFHVRSANINASFDIEHCCL